MMNLGWRMSMTAGFQTVDVSEARHLGAVWELLSLEVVVRGGGGEH